MKASRKWLAHELAQFAVSLPPGSRVLDAGSGDQRYRQLFGAHIYESADFEQVNKPYAKSTYTCDLKAIPVGDATYDAIVFTQVMEHLSEPLLVLKELHRVVKDGCPIFYSGPFCWEEHEVPYDFYRYTQFGIRHLFAQAGFKVEDIRWMEGFASTAASHIRHVRRYMPKSPKALGGGINAWVAVLLLIIMSPALKILARQMEECDKNFRYTTKGFPLNYIATARK